MSQRQTQTADYWVEDFKVEQADIEHLYNVLLERETPLSPDEMALVLVRYRVQQEEDALEKKAHASDVYHPQNTYKVGDEILFPLLNNTRGKVTSTRAGDNSDYGDFTVVEVEFASGQKREFSSGLKMEHRLNEVEEVSTQPDDDLLASEELFIEYGGSVAKAIEERLEEHEDLVRLAGRWFPRSLLADVHVGHLNLAEAVLDMIGGGPMTTPEILDQIGMLQGINERLAEFSMNYALQEDPRFDEVGPAGQVLWYLVRMEPEGVRTPPPRLAYTPLLSDPNSWTPELVELEREIEDEHSDIPMVRSPRPQSVTVTLTYAHRRAGTLPLSHQLRRMFPTAYEAPRIRFTLVDPQSSDEIPAWVVRPGGYVYGLEGWFGKYDVPTGGYLTISRTDVPGRVEITYAKRNPRKEWIRSASVENNQLRFENRQRTIGCDYDELMIIDVEDEAAIDALWQRTQERDVPLEKLMVDIGKELASLNPQGNIHAKTLYSAINIVRRSPPGPIFTYLIGLPQFEHVGGLYWHLKESQSNS